jgi:hypothetical protein
MSGTISSGIGVYLERGWCQPRAPSRDPPTTTGKSSHKWLLLQFVRRQDNRRSISRVGRPDGDWSSRIGRGPGYRDVARSAPRRRGCVPWEWCKKCRETRTSVMPASRAARLTRFHALTALIPLARRSRNTRFRGDAARVSGQRSAALSGYDHAHESKTSGRLYGLE